jgi:hypothetical protein
MSEQIDLTNKLFDPVTRPVMPDGQASASTEFAHPDDVLGNETLTHAEKRAVLASWASDVRAIINQPALRMLDNGAIVRLDDILRALSHLDSSEPATVVGPATVVSPPKTIFRPPFKRRRRRTIPAWLFRAARQGRTDGDDDPPPCPALASIPVRPCFATDECRGRQAVTY